MVRPRAMAILKAVVKEYVDTCAPVGSKALVDHHDMGVSSATVRSDLAGLERSGHLTHPHVSAGRVPTDLGYRTVVNGQDRICALEPLARFRAIQRSTDLRALSRAMAQLTQCVAVVSQPRPQDSRVARLSLTQLSPHHIMLVLVLGNGHVASRSLGADLPKEEIARVEEVAQELVEGDRIRKKTNHPLLSEAANTFLERVMEAAQSLAVSAGPHSQERFGMALLLAQPEFKDPNVTRVVVDALEDEDLAWEGTPLFDGEGLMVSIGQENLDRRLQAMSIVAKEYHALAGVGSVACVGPTRMDYPLVIGVVEAGAKRACAIVGETSWET